MMTLQNFIFVKTFNDNLPKRCAVEGEATRFHYFATPLYFWSKFRRSFPSDTKDIWHIPGKGHFKVFGMKSGPRKILPFWKRKSYWPKFPNHWWVRCDWSINFISVPFYILMNSICSRYAHLESRHHETLFDGFIQKWRQMFDQIGLIWHHSFAEGLYLYFNRPFCRKKSLLILNPDQVGPETPSRFFVTIKVLWRLIRVMDWTRTMNRASWAFTL